MGFLSAILSTYLHRLETKGGATQERVLTLIARSPASPAARALSVHAKGLEREQISVQIIFAKLAPTDLLIELATALNIMPSDGASSASTIRFIKSPGLLNAHEQLVLGVNTCWTGDMLRRSEEQRNGLDILEEEDPGSVRLAQFAFNAIWDIARPAPSRAFVIRRTTPMPVVAPIVAAAELAAAENNSAPIRRTLPAITRH
ncbi:MAG: hypothetical protein P8Y36_08855 [Alphaproteobacteria bacterium]